MSTSPEVALVEAHLHTLKLPSVRRDFQRVAREAADGGWSYESYLRALLEQEVVERNARAVAARVRQAGFPEIRTLASLDHEALSGITAAKLAELEHCTFVEDARDIVIAGPVGTGKTHVAIGLGMAAAERRMHVLFRRAADLVRDLIEARDEHALGRLQRRLTRTQLLIVDELGFVPFDRRGGELLFNLLSDRHGQSSTLVTTNLAFGEWGQVFGSPKMTVALLDRLCYRADILVTSGSSYRTRGRLAAAALKSV